MSFYGNQVQDYYQRIFRQIRAERKKIFENIRTREDALRYVEAARKRLRSIYKLPQDHTPPAYEITGRTVKEAYTIDKMIIYSAPDYPISAALYLPADYREGEKLPCCVFTCGHGATGKADYQTAIIRMTLRGCAVLAFDPIGQGERCQYREDFEKEEQNRFFSPEELAPFITGEIRNTPAHNLFGRRILWLGEHFGEMRAADAIRVIDLAVALPQVDPDRVALFGNSGGGTMTTIVTMLEDRLAAAAPSCYITTWLRNVENEVPVDAEQIPPRAAEENGEMADMLIAVAPRPLHIQTQKLDFFDLRGAKETYAEVAHIYKLLGCEDKLSFGIGSNGHGLHYDGQQAICNFMSEQLNTKHKSDVFPEEVMEFLPDEETFATPNGWTIDLPGTKTIHRIICDKVEDAVKNRRRHSEDEIREFLLKQLDLTGEIPVPEYRSLRHRPLISGAKESVWSRFGLEPEPEMTATLLWRTPKICYVPPEIDAADGGEVELYFPHQDSAAELESRPLPEKGHLFGIDYRGIGENMPTTADHRHEFHFFSHYHFDYHYSSLGLLTGHSYLGCRVRDGIAALKFLRSRGAGKVVVSASGIGRVVALLTAFLTPEIEVELRFDAPLKDAYYYALCKDAPMPQSMVVPGMLHVTDFSEIEAIVRGR